jgi:putative phage-type endonuclease
MSETIHAPAQGTGAWLNQRVGRLTASRMADAMAVLKSGKPSEARRKLMIELLAERLTGDAVPHFVSADMQWGIEQEPVAKSAYEARSGTLLTPCGFFLHPDIEHFGATPDALIDDDSVIEFKCPRTTTHVTWMLEGGVPDQHKPQILAQLSCTGRQRAVFASFDPRMPEKHQLYVAEWEPQFAELEAVEDAARSFLAELDAMFRKVVESN